MNKAVFITGAQAGTGYGIAEHFAAKGFDVFVTSRNGAEAEKAANRLNEKYGVFSKGYECNIRNEQQVIDILSANAGVVSVSIDEEGVRVETTKKMPININVGHGTQFTFCCKYSKEVDITKCFETICAIYERYEGYFEANIVPVNGEVMIKLYASASEIPADEFNEIFDYI